MDSRVHLYLLLLLTAFSADAYHFQFVVNATRLLHKIFNFETFVIFQNASAVRAHVKGPSLEQSLQLHFATPMICLTGNTPDTMRLRNTVKNNGLALVILDTLTDPIRQLADIVLTKLHSLKMMFVVTDPAADVSEFSSIEFFSWCWKNNVIDVVLTYSVNEVRHEVLTYTPFPDRIQIVNRTGVPASGYFWNKVVNVMGYKFVTPVFVDEPLVMKVYDKETDTMDVTGNAGRLYKEFLRHINAKFNVVSLSNGSMHLHQRRVVQMTADRVIDISIHPFTYLLPYAADGSYPIAHTNACIILPVVPEIDRSHYVFYAFNGQMWLIIFGLFMTFLVMHLIAKYTRKRALSPTSCQWKTRGLVHILLVFTWFCVSNLYVGALTSLLSTTVYGRQPETVDDILRTGLEILLLDYEERAFFKNKLFPSSLRVRVTDPDTLARHRNKLNTSFAYIVKEERWKMIDYQQSRLWKPIFRIANNFCVPNMFLSFPIQIDSPFYEVLKGFTLRADSSGLYMLWSSQSPLDARNAGLIKVMNETREHPVPLKVEHLKLVFEVLAVSFAACFCCFLREICTAKRHDK